MNEPAAGHLLVVDDSPTVRKLVELTFRSTHWTITFAGSGSDAIARARAASPSVILLDVVLPDMPALDVCRQLSTDPRTQHIPVVLMSAKDETVWRQFAQYDSVVDFIQKPFTPTDLSARLRAALQKKGPAKSQEKTLMGGRWPAAAVCSLIGASARTGELVFRTESSAVAVYWSSGEIVLVSSFEPADYLSALSPQQQKQIPTAVLNRAENIQRESGKPVLTTLSEQKALPAACELERTLREVGKELLRKVLSSGVCPFEWRELPRLPEFVADHGRRLPVSRSALELGHVVKHAPLEANADWPSVQAVFRHSGRLSAQMKDTVLSVRERRVLGLIDGRTPLSTVAKNAGLDAEYVRQMAHSFTSLGLIEPGTSGLGRES
jgi:CheY-like chemotaxis protein